MAQTSLRPTATQPVPLCQGVEEDASGVDAIFEASQEILDELYASRGAQQVYRPPLLKTQGGPLKPSQCLFLESKYLDRLRYYFGKFPRPPGLLPVQRFPRREFGALKLRWLIPRACSKKSRLWRSVIFL
jgi:hypothetical protein